MNLTILAVILGVIIGVAFANKSELKAEWSYKDSTKVYGKTTYGPKDWGEKYEKCKGKAQSPINIDSKKAKKTKFGPLKLKFEGAKDGFFSGKIMNNGHAPQFTLDKTKGNISIEFDKKTYFLQQFHFHFGCVHKERRGSEHTVDEKASSAELHLVFHNKKYKYEKALKEKDGLFVIGVLIEKSGNPYYYVNRKNGIDALLMPAVNVLASGYVRVGNPIVDLELPLEKLVPSLSYKEKEDAPAYYTYKGSLTTPGCFETVRWVVLKKPVELSGYMLNSFRYLITDSPTYALLCDNYRPTQKLNDRKVEHFEPEKKKKKDAPKPKNKDAPKTTKGESA